MKIINKEILDRFFNSFLFYQILIFSLQSVNVDLLFKTIIFLTLTMFCKKKIFF